MCWVKEAILIWICFAGDAGLDSKLELLHVDQIFSEALARQQSIDI